MSLLALGLVFLGCIFAATYHILTKKVQTGAWSNRSSAVVAFGHGGAALLCFVACPLTGGLQIDEGFWPPVIATGLVNIVIAFAKIRARALEDVSLVVPIDSTTPAAVIVTSILILGEEPSPAGWVGIWLMVIGTYSLNIQEVRVGLEKRLGDDSQVSPWRRRFRIWFVPFLALGKSRGVRWALLASMLGALTLNYDGLTARRANVAFGLGIIYTIVGLGNLGIGLVRREFSNLNGWDVIKKMTPLAVTWVIYGCFIGFAYRLDIVPYVGTLKRLQIPLTILAAYVILRERKSFKQRLAGGLIMATGAALMTIK